MNPVDWAEALYRKVFAGVPVWFAYVAVCGIAALVAISVAGFILSLGIEKYRQTDPSRLANVVGGAKRGAHLKTRVPVWTLKRTENARELELVGHFFNAGDIDTTATMTIQVLVDGEDVTEAADKQPIQMEYSVLPPTSAEWRGPLLYLHGRAYTAATKAPDTIEVRTEFVYPDGLGTDMRLDHRIRFYKNLKLGVQRDVTEPIKHRVIR